MSPVTLSRPLSKQRKGDLSPKSSSSTAVFSINFIRNEFLPLRTRRILVYVALGYLALHIFWTAGLVGQAFYLNAKAANIERQIGNVAPPAVFQKETISGMETLYERAVQDLGRVKTVDHLMKRRFLNTAKWDAVTRTLPARTWISEISGDRGTRTLNIHAMYLVDPAKPYELPTKNWMQALRADPRFSRGLKRFELGSSSQKTQGAAELFSFEWIAEWEPEAEA